MVEHTPVVFVTICRESLEAVSVGLWVQFPPWGLMANPKQKKVSTKVGKRGPYETRGLGYFLTREGEKLAESHRKIMNYIDINGLSVARDLRKHGFKEKFIIEMYKLKGFSEEQVRTALKEQARKALKDKK